MKLIGRFLNKSEKLVRDELSAIAADNALCVYVKPRLSDVIDKGNSHLGTREFTFYAQAHFDFLLTDINEKPVVVVEYDGPAHDRLEQIERDHIKNRFCREAQLPIIRIKANHVIRKFRGITLLRWIVEVMELQNWFDEAQKNGQVPYDEDFDPLMIVSDGKGRRWPYWISADASLRINNFLRQSSGAKARMGLTGIDDDGNHHRLEYIRINDEFLYAKTAVRHQDAPLDVFSLASEISCCEIGAELARYMEGKANGLSLNEFRIVHDRICRKYKMHQSHWTGDVLDFPQQA